MFKFHWGSMCLLERLDVVGILEISSLGALGYATSESAEPRVLL